MIIKNVYYHTQRNNEDYPYTSCLPTSVAMVIDYIVYVLLGKNKTDFGCGKNEQIEDFITDLCYSRWMQGEMKKHESEWGSWIWNHPPQTVLYIVNHLINEKILKDFNYTSKVNWSISPQVLFDTIRNKLPCVILGNFSNVSSIGGHYNCAIGYDEDTVIVNDPWGDANTGYKITDGSELVYSWDFFRRSINNSFGITFEKS